MSSDGRRLNEPPEPPECRSRLRAGHIPMSARTTTPANDLA